MSATKPIRTIGEFVELVKLMREYQKVFFKENSPIALRRAKEYGAKVDRAIREREERAAEQQQPGLPGCTSNTRSN